MQSPPNILLIMADQHRWDWIGCAGVVPVRTPNIDRLAERGMRFTQARCNAPLCSPSRACFVTGMRPHSTGVPNNQEKLDPRSPTFMKAFRDAGYRVGQAGKADIHEGGRGFHPSGWTTHCGKLGFTDTMDHGGKFSCFDAAKKRPLRDPYLIYLEKHGLLKTWLDDFERRMPDRYDELQLASWPSPLPREHLHDDFIGRNAVSILEHFPADSPWLHWVNFANPHNPFDAPREVLNHYSNVEFPQPSRGNPGEHHQRLRRNYSAMIEVVDDWVGKLVDAVAERGEIDNTYIIYTSDHGEMLGDYGLWYKQIPPEPAVRVPLIMAGPDMPNGSTSNALIELCDFPATLLELAGLPGMEGWDSRSFVPVARGRKKRHRPYCFAMLHDWRSITDGKWKLVAREGKPLELYRLDRDPAEAKNLALMPKYAARLRLLRRELQRASSPTLAKRRPSRRRVRSRA